MKTLHSTATAPDSRTADGQLSKLWAAREHCLLEIAAKKNVDSIAAAASYLTRKDRPLNLGTEEQPRLIGYSLVVKRLADRIEAIATCCERIHAGGDFSIQAIKSGLGHTPAQFQTASAELGNVFGRLRVVLESKKSLTRLFGEVDAKHCLVPLDPEHQVYKGVKMNLTDQRIIDYWNQAFTNGKGKVDSTLLPRMKAAVNGINKEALEIQKNIERLLS
jgi:hypothetical protein